MTDEYGLFPFGRPNTARPMRMPLTAAAKALVVGVYPSAWHIRWTAPTHLGGGKVAALAVDVEPEVFWNGDGADFADRLQTWKTVTGFIEGDYPGAHGTVAAKSPATNGSSGAKVEARYLAPLGIEATQAAFTDVCPVFFVKHGGGKRRQQGDAIAAEYDPIASALGFARSSLPRRPSAEALVARASTEFADRIVADLEQADVDVVVTLGEESLQALRRVEQLKGAPAAETLADLYNAGRYGAEGTLRVNGRAVAWLPLVHPGRLTGNQPAETSQLRVRSRDWNAAHSEWERAKRF